MISRITHHTDLYSAQTNIEKETIGVDKNEIERYFRLLLQMSIFPAHYYRFFWDLGNHMNWHAKYLVEIALKLLPDY